MDTGLLTTSDPKFLTMAEGCTVCGLCEAIAPEVFRVTEAGCALRPEGRGRWTQFVEEVRQAALLCPSGAIRFEREEGWHG